MTRPQHAPQGDLSIAARPGATRSVGRRAASVFAALGLLASASPVVSCPLCKETLKEQPNAAGDGFSASTLFLLAVLLCLLSALVVAILRQVRAVDALNQARSQRESPPPAAALRERSR